MLAAPKFHACQDRSVLGWISYSERDKQIALASIDHLNVSGRIPLWTVSGQFCLVQ
jgi:hypothetical protein